MNLKNLRLIVDTRPHILEVPSDIVVQNTGKEASRVRFQSNPTDNFDGTINTSCSPLSSGDIFPVGITKITCKATDRANNRDQQKVQYMINNIFF